MAIRRGVKGALAGAGEGLAQWGQSYLQLGLAQQNRDEQLSAQLIKDYSDRVAKGEMAPEQAEAAIRAQNPRSRLPPGYFQSLVPSVATRLAGITGKIDAADSVAKVPSVGQIGNEMAARHVPTMIPGKIDPSTGVNDSRLSSPLTQLLEGRNDKLDAFPAVRVPGVYVPGENGQGGHTEERFVPAREANQPRTFQTGPTPTQKGFDEAQAEIAKIHAGNAGQLPEAKGEAFVREEDVTRAAKAKTTGANTTASRAAGLPFDRSMSDYNANQPTLATFNDPKTGTEQQGTIRRVTGETRMLPNPQGLEPGKAQLIPATIADNTAGINTAEIEGMKVLRALRASGLNQSNDPFDPRWTKFLVNTLKVAPEDLSAADMQQRIGFINAAMTRALMGSRPSQYVAQTIIQPHLPKQEMTGKQLDLVLQNVLEQATERRTEFAHTTGLPIERLAPQGDSWAAYQREFGVPTNKAPMFTVGPNGELIPIMQRTGRQ